MYFSGVKYEQEWIKYVFEGRRNWWIDERVEERVDFFFEVWVPTMFLVDGEDIVVECWRRVSDLGDKGRLNRQGQELSGFPKKISAVPFQLSGWLDSENAVVISAEVVGESVAIIRSRSLDNAHSYEWGQSKETWLDCICFFYTSVTRAAFQAEARLQKHRVGYLLYVQKRVSDCKCEWHEVRRYRC